MLCLSHSVTEDFFVTFINMYLYFGIQMSSIKLALLVYVYIELIVHFVKFISYILSLAGNTHSPTSHQTNSKDQSLKDPTSPDVGKLLIILFI